MKIWQLIIIANGGLRMEGNKGTMVCKSCGAELTEGKNFCPSCGAQQNEPEAQNIQQSAPTEKACAACGSMMGAVQQFCPVCGTAASADVPQQAKKKTNKKIIWAIAAVGVIILAVVLFFVIRGVPVDSVRLNKTSVTLKVGEKVELEYTISPENAKNQEVSWSTSNNDVVEITDGTILGLEEGSCVVTVKSSNGKTAECDVIIEPAGPDFAEIAETLGNPSFLVVASDGS
jgi:RNA polymerase subunit RPABC4/transcription elongation factor Spt4